MARKARQGIVGDGIVESQFISEEPAATPTATATAMRASLTHVPIRPTPGLDAAAVRTLADVTRMYAGQVLVPKYRPGSHCIAAQATASTEYQAPGGNRRGGGLASP